MSEPGHWQSVYQRSTPDELSWYQPTATLSASIIADVAPSITAQIIDVGGGASTLVDALVVAGHTGVTVLDLAPAALAQAQARIGAAGASVRWLSGDVLTLPLAPASVDVWHDRAVFHFLTDQLDRAQYIRQVRRTVRPGGHVLVATFAEDGPTRCSGLDVIRYSAAELHGAFGAGFQLERSVREIHRTPTGREQAFNYCLCRWAA